jgi:hypothetical protein
MSLLFPAINRRDGDLAAGARPPRQTELGESVSTWTVTNALRAGPDGSHFVSDLPTGIGGTCGEQEAAVLSGRPPDIQRAGYDSRGGKVGRLRLDKVVGCHKHTGQLKTGSAPIAIRQRSQPGSREERSLLLMTKTSILQNSPGCSGSPGCLRDTSHPLSPGCSSEAGIQLRECGTPRPAPYRSGPEETEGL